MKKNTCSTIGDLKKLLNSLKAENDPSNKDLIDFYTNKIEVESKKALNKILSN